MQLNLRAYLTCHRRPFDFAHVTAAEVSKHLQVLARAIEPDHQKVKLYIEALLGMDFFGNASLRDA